jgi:DNA-binding IscR family transcriptional regulator
VVGRAKGRDAALHEAARLRAHGDAQASRCTLRKPARKLQAAIANLLDTTTLAELTGDDVPVALAAQR